MKFIQCKSGHEYVHSNVMMGIKDCLQIFLFSLSRSLAELEKEVHNIRSGLKALEAVSELLCSCVMITPSGSSLVCNYVF